MINRLKIARIEAGMTQLQLAEKIGVTRQTIGLIEKGAYNPTLNLCQAICRVLGKTLDDLFWTEEEPNHEKN
ncbi:MAG: helix-turn-helix transcriptional regulator [Sporolactobacillus sp.]|nr:helix-turn-helix transcriptional regulator [Sporolactobacillus sp.]